MVSKASADLEKIVSFDLIDGIIKNAAAKKIITVYNNTSMVLSSLM
jgi:hypothetical protein